MRDKLVFLAPHLEYPPRNGSDIYIERLARHLSSFSKVIILAKDKQITYENNSIVQDVPFLNDLRPKTLAAIRTIWFRSHYLLERFITKTYFCRAKKLIEQNREATILCSFMITTNILAGVPFTVEKKAVFTHNNEILWFTNQRKYSNNPFHKYVAFISEGWVYKFLAQYSSQYLFIHISDLDFEAYKKKHPTQTGIIVPAGVDMQPLPPFSAWDGILRLLFVGSLSTKTNYDAVLFFTEQFWPLIKKKFENKVQIYLAGSRPGQSLRRLCALQNWSLLADISDEDLQALYGRSTFAILPFSYTTGAKIKLLSSLAGGLPVMATNSMKYLPGLDFAPNLYSDYPEEWVQHLSRYMATGINSQHRKACQEFAMQFGWEKIAKNMNGELMSRGL